MFNFSHQTCFIEHVKLYFQKFSKYNTRMDELGLSCAKLIKVGPSLDEPEQKGDNPQKCQRKWKKVNRKAF